MVVIQEEYTGCGIASVANIVKLPYSTVKKKANSIGIFAEDDTLFSDVQYVRKLLREYNVNVSKKETSFESWEKLPDIALLSIKFREEGNRSYWHWVLFKREAGKSFVIDSAAYLKENIRTDFHAMAPKWFIEIIQT